MSRAVKGERRDAALHSALQPRLQSDRDRLLQTQSAAVQAAERTVDAVWNRIGESLKEFSPTECANFFAATGYEPV